MKKRLIPVMLMAAIGAMAVGANAEETDAYVYTTLNIPYADYYYGELNAIEPEEPGTATEGQYDAEDAVTAAGYREEGIYDAVTSATTQKSIKFGSAYTEETEDGINILGAANVNVAISRSLYEDALQAIEDGTECSNPLLDFVEQIETVSEEAPAEYKVLNSDGTLSKTIGNQTVASEATATITTSSVWGNYQISIEGVELESGTIQGAILEASDGSLYGLEHEDNLWLQPSEIAFAVEAFSEPHGNDVAYQRFADIQGKTITKITFLLANEDDVVVETELLCKYLLSDGEGLTAPESVSYSVEGTAVVLEMAAPEGVTYTLSEVEGAEVLDEASYSLDGDTLTLSADCKPGYYTITYASETHADVQAEVLVTSNLEAGVITVENNAITVAENEEGITAADYTANISSVTINGEAVSGRNPGSVIFDEEGNVLLDAETTDSDGNAVAIFEEGVEYTIEVTSDGYPDASGTVVK